MKLISISALMTALLCGFVGVSHAAPAPAQPLSAQTTDEIIIRAPDVVRRPLPRPGPGAPPGLTNPEIISLTRAVSYADLDLSKAADVSELEARVRNTARDVCLELARRYPRQGAQYTFADADCVKKATDDGMDTVKAITAALVLK